MADEPIELAVTVEADFSQFYLRRDAVTDDSAKFAKTHLTSYFEGNEDLQIVAARQFGNLPVEMRFFDKPAAQADDTWHDVVEFSIRATSATYLSGWEPRPGDIKLPLTPGIAYRVRYAISDMDVGRESRDEPYPERYRLDFWPAPLEAARVITQMSQHGRYWLLSTRVSAIRDDIYARRAGTTENQRLSELADTAFGEFPDLLKDVRDGSGGGWMTSTAWRLTDDVVLHARAKMRTLAPGEMIADMALANARVQAFFEARARLFS